LGEQPECVLDIEVAQKLSPESIDIVGSGIDTRPPQPHRLVTPTAGEMVDGPVYCTGSSAAVRPNWNTHANEGTSSQGTKPFSSAFNAR
jgi:hypothetical protein